METTSRDENAQAQASENRTQERQPGRGFVQIYLDGRQEPLLAQLVNASSSGVRIRLQQDCVRPGDNVRLRYPWGEVVGRVVWCTKRGGVEAGLFVP